MLQRYSASPASLLRRLPNCCRPAVATIRTLASATTANSAESSKEQIHVTIVGGGAAGLTAAFFAAEHGAKVTVLERTREAGKKILMSGGSRCNVLPEEVDLQTDYFSDSSFSAVRAVFASWSLDLCRAWLEDPYWGVGLDLQLEEETKKYFPASNSSKEVRDRLVAACLARGVDFRYNASVEGLEQVVVSEPPGSQPSEAPGQPAAMASAGDVSPAAAGGSEESRGQSDSDGDNSDGDRGSSGGADEDAVRRASGAAAGSSTVADGGVGGGAGKRGKKGSRNARARAAASTAAAAGDGVVGGGSGDEGQDPPTRWLCRLKDGTTHVTDKLLVATGGLSFPAVGTDGTGHRLLRALGHTLQDPYPALTPLTGRHPAGEQLAGVSMYGIELSVQVPGTKRPKVSERTALLFTHRGYSGPAVLDLSHFAVKALTRGSHPPPPPPSSPATAAAAGAGLAAKAPAVQQPQSPTASVVSGGGGGGGAYLGSGLPALRVNWTAETPVVWDERLQAGGIALVSTVLQRHGLRERLAEALVSELGLAGRRVCDVKKGERAALVTALTSYELPYSGHEGYKKAEVTGGGVRLEEVNCATMESRLLPGLFLCGECVDVFGRIGGFNFYWAWVSGRLAGIGAATGGKAPLSARKANRRDRRGGAVAGAGAAAAVAAVS